MEHTNYEIMEKPVKFELEDGQEDWSLAAIVDEYRVSSNVMPMITIGASGLANLNKMARNFAQGRDYVRILRSGDTIGFEFLEQPEVGARKIWNSCKGKQRQFYALLIQKMCKKEQTRGRLVLKAAGPNILAVRQFLWDKGKTR